MHNKFCIIDNKILINGSYNWTYFAENKNSGNILIIKEEPNTINEFKKEFRNITQQLDQINDIKTISQFEIDEFDELSAKAYLANDIIYEAFATNRPEIVQSAFKLSPNNIKVQQKAVNLGLTNLSKLQYSIGISLKDNKYLIGVEKGTSLPVSISRLVRTSVDNQTACSTTLFYGENDIAHLNKKMPGKSLNGKTGGVKIDKLPPKPQGKAELKIIFTIDLFGSLNVRIYSLDNGASDFYSCKINNLLMNEITEESNL